jgi:hypothetical protein
MRYNSTFPNLGKAHNLLVPPNSPGKPSGVSISEQVFVKSQEEIRTAQMRSQIGFLRIPSPFAVKFPCKNSGIKAINT